MNTPRAMTRKTPEEIAGEMYNLTATAIEKDQFGFEALAQHIPYALGHNKDGFIAWQKRVLPPEGKVVELERFEDYLLLPVREGFGLPSLYFVDGTMKLLGKKGRKALAALRQEIPDWDARIEREAAQRMEAATEPPQRGNPTGSNQYQRKKETGNLPLSSTQVSRAESNNVGVRTQRKLDKLTAHPELLEKVRAGELSVHRAAVAAGIVKAPEPMDVAKRAFLKLSVSQRLEFWRWAHEQ